MNREILIISKPQVEALRHKLQDNTEPDSCAQELRDMIEIKSTLVWRADAACACIGPGWASRLDGEVQILENTQRELEAGNIAAVISLLAEYENMIS